MNRQKTEHSSLAGEQSCPICGAQAYRFADYRGINSDNRREVSLFKGRTISRCGRCRYAFCDSPIDCDKLMNYYAADFWTLPKYGLLKSLATCLQKDKPFMKDIAISVAKSWGRESTPRVLEVGAGAAFLLRALRRLQPIQAFAVEPTDAFLNVYRVHRINRVARFFETAADGPYDIILSRHWLEHIVDLHGTLRRLRSLLSPGGLLFTEVPNTEEPYWTYRHFPDPPHLHYFTPAAFEALFRSHGFRILSVDTWGSPLESEKGVGYLKPDSPVCLSRAELKSLQEERERKRKPLKPGCNPHGRENLRALVIREE